MSTNKNVSFLTVLIALVALIVAVVALVTSKTARELALSEVEIEERNSLVTPIFNEASGEWSFLALYEVGVSNLSGPDVLLRHVAKETKGAGFLVPLNQDQVVADVDLQPKAVLFDESLAQIEADPRLLKDLAQKEMADVQPVNIMIRNGETKTLRFGVMLRPYDSNQDPLARMVLLSYQLNFDNGKSVLFRRGFPILALKAE